MANLLIIIFLGIIATVLFPPLGMILIAIGFFGAIGLSLGIVGNAFKGSKPDPNVPRPSDNLNPKLLSAEEHQRIRDKYFPRPNYDPTVTFDDPKMEAQWRAHQKKRKRKKPP